MLWRYWCSAPTSYPRLLVRLAGRGTPSINFAAGWNRRFAAICRFPLHAGHCQIGQISHRSLEPPFNVSPDGISAGERSELADIWNQVGQTHEIDDHSDEPPPVNDSLLPMSPPSAPTDSSVDANLN